MWWHFIKSNSLEVTGGNCDIYVFETTKTENVH